MDEEKILDKISSPFISRLKIPIISTYISVLIIYNWDILFFLIFEPIYASKKIEYIKANFSDSYFERIFCCVLISVLLLISFTILNTGLNYLLKWFYKKDKEFSSEIEDLQIVDNLRTELSTQINKNKELHKKNSNLENIINEYNSKSIKLDSKKISKNDLDNLLVEISNNPDSEKLKYSLNELLEQLIINDKTYYKTILSNSKYPESMETLFSYLEHLNLAFVDQINNLSSIRMSNSFKDFVEFKKQNYI